MSDHTINLALLILALVTSIFEAGIFWMILQDYRKVREMPELSPKRLIVLSFLSLGPILALFLVWLFATNLRPKLETTSQVAQASWWPYVLLLLVGTAVIGWVIGRLVKTQTASLSALPTEKPKEPSKLVINWANYRAVENGGEEFQVGDFLRQIISGDSLVFDISNHNFVIGDKNFVPRDPLPGKEKRLQVNYSYGGMPPVTTERRERGRLLLPEDSKITWLAGERDRLIREVDLLKEAALTSAAQQIKTENVLRRDWSGDWKELSGRFEPLTRSGILADSQKSEHYERWSITGGDNATAGRIVTLCKHAGELLSKSPNVSRGVPIEILNIVDASDRWLSYLKYSKPSSFRTLGYGVDNGQPFHAGGIIDLALVSANECLECAGKEY